MQDHIRALLPRFQYSQELKETSVFRILIGGEAPSQVMLDLNIHNGYTLRNWVSQYQGMSLHKVTTASPRQDVRPLQQRFFSTLAEKNRSPSQPILWLL